MFKKRKDSILIGLGLFFLLGSVVMIEEDISATVCFGIISVICLFFGRDAFIDYINKNKMKKLLREYELEKFKITESNRIEQLKFESELNKKEIEVNSEMKIMQLENEYKIKMLNIQSNFKNRKNINNEFLDIDSLPNGYAFERYIVDLLEKLNYENIKTTQASNDYGVDVLAEKNGTRYAIQCKMYSHPVGNKAIQEVVSGKNFYDAHVAVVATNSIFTKNAKELARSNKVLLWDKHVLEEMINSIGETVNI